MALKNRQKLWMATIFASLTLAGIFWPPAWLLLFALVNFYFAWVFLIHNALADAIGTFVRIEKLPFHKRAGQYFCPAVGVIFLQCFSTVVFPPLLAGFSIAAISMLVAWGVRKTESYTPQALAGFAAFFVVFAITSFAVLYSMNGIITPTAKSDHNFKHALYFSTVTWTTLGYGDYQPTEPLQLVAATEALCGYVTMAMFLGALLVVKDKERQDESKKVSFSQINEWFQNLTLGQDCELQVRRDEDRINVTTKRTNGSVQVVEIDLSNNSVRFRDVKPE